MASRHDFRIDAVGQSGGHRVGRPFTRTAVDRSAEFVDGGVSRIALAEFLSSQLVLVE